MKDLFSFFVKNSAPVKIFYLDEWAVEQMVKQYGIALSGCREPLLSMKEYLGKRQVSPKRLGVTFGFCGGSIWGERKGADQLLGAFLKAELPAGSRLLYVGQCKDPAMLEYFESAQKTLGDRLIIQNGFFSNEKLFTIIDHQMDVVCLPYRDYRGTSGFYAQAATLNKVILLPDYGWLGWEGRKNAKVRFFQNQSVDSLKACLEQTAVDFERIQSLKSNYLPTGEAEFVRALAGV
jgi:hypothetical protein